MARVPSPRPARPPLWWAALTLGWLALVWFVPAGVASAQAPDPAAAPAAAEPPAAEPAPAGADAPAPAKAAPAATTARPEAPRSTMLAYLLKAHSDPFSALIGLVLLGLSIYFVAQVIRLGLEFRVSEAVPPALIERLETCIKERKFQEAYDACRDDNSVLARLVRTGIANLPTGRSEAKDAMNLLADEITVTMESRISYLATIGTLGPMIGLVGTIWGMIRSFQEIAMAAGTQPRADQVASGISTALFITLEGVSLSTPAIFFYAYFRNRIAQIMIEATKVADRTIAAFYAAAKGGTPAAAVPSTTTAPAGASVTKP
jgi:biopolymer transport protein ExbB